MMVCVYVTVPASVGVLVSRGLQLWGLCPWSARLLGRLGRLDQVPERYGVLMCLHRALKLGEACKSPASRLKQWALAAVRMYCTWYLGQCVGVISS